MPAASPKCIQVGSRRIAQKATLLAELEYWRNNVIHDKGVSFDFRAKAAFPPKCPTPVMDDWVKANATNYDFNRYGWPAWYPTRTLAEWERARAKWEPYVFRKPTDQVKRPSLVHSKRKKPKKK